MLDCGTTLLLLNLHSCLVHLAKGCHIWQKLCPGWQKRVHNEGTWIPLILFGCHKLWHIGKENKMNKEVTPPQWDPNKDSNPWHLPGSYSPQGSGPSHFILAFCSTVAPPCFFSTFSAAWSTWPKDDIWQKIQKLWLGWQKRGHNEGTWIPVILLGRDTMKIRKAQTHHPASSPSSAQSSQAAHPNTYKGHQGDVSAVHGFHGFPKRLHACDFIWVPQIVAHGP